MRRAVLASVLLASLPGADAAPVVTRQVGRVSIRAEAEHAWPGGLFVVTVRGSAPPVLAILDGRRVPFFAVPGGLRALVPLSLLAEPDDGVLGIELRSRGRVRIPVHVQIVPRAYGSRTEVIPAAKRALLADPAQQPAARTLLEQLRTRSGVQRWRTPFRAPVTSAPEPSFGLHETWLGGEHAGSRLDATWGDEHRGLDYPVPAGTPVGSPTGGVVIASTRLPANGETVVIDHGHGVVSAFFHLAKRAVYDGQVVSEGDVIGSAGDTGIAARPHVHWGLYVNGIAVDPRVFFDPIG